MGEIPRNSDFEDSNSKLSNSANKGLENPDDFDIRRRYMKMQGEIERIINNGTISDLGGDKALEVKNITSFIEGNVASVLDILKISDKEKIIGDSSQQISSLSRTIEGQVEELLQDKEKFA